MFKKNDYNIVNKQKKKYFGNLFYKIFQQCVLNLKVPKKKMWKQTSIDNSATSNKSQKSIKCQQIYSQHW